MHVKTCRHSTAPTYTFPRLSFSVVYKAKEHAPKVVLLPRKKFDMLLDGITELNALSNEMLYIERYKSCKATPQPPWACVCYTDFLALSFLC